MFMQKVVFDVPESLIADIADIFTGMNSFGFNWNADLANAYGQFSKKTLGNKTLIYDRIYQAE